jgi:hypothetical protein
MGAGVGHRRHLADELFRGAHARIGGGFVNHQAFR